MAGTLVVDGSINEDAGLVEVFSGAQLQGTGQIGASVSVQAGGTISPGNVADSESSLQIRSLSAAAGSTYAVQLNGITAGVDYDQLVLDSSNITDDSVSIDGTILDLAVNFTPPPATEFILIDNDGVDAITGRLSVNFDVDGNPTNSPRVLNEGDEVLSQIGGAAESAFITYFGGDGNDVAIVTANDVVVPGGTVTLVTRRGINLEIRTGADLATAQLATPTVRPIAGLNTNNLVITGDAGNNTLFVDVDRFVDASGTTINFDGNIFFDAGEDGSDFDRLVVFDSNPATDDSPLATRYEFSSQETGVLNVDTQATADFTISFANLESIEQTVAATESSVAFTGDNEQVVLSADPNATDQTLLTTTVNGISSTLVSLLNPTGAFSVDTGDGDDQIDVQALGSSTAGMRAALSFNGGSGVDSFVLRDSLRLGRGDVTGDFLATAETVNISGNIDTTGGTQSGAVRLVGGTIVSVDSSAVVNAGQSTIEIDANGGAIDTSQGDLISASNGDAFH